MPKLIDIEKEENIQVLDLSSAIIFHNDKWLNELLDEGVDIDVSWNDDGDIQTLLSTAINFNNENAVRILCHKLKSKNLLHTHISQESLEATPLHYAAYLGNPNIAKLLLSYGADANAFSGNTLSGGDTPLMCAIRRFSTYSLIFDGDWGNKQSQEALKLWYEGKGKFPKEALTVKWSGKTKFMSLLLEQGNADPGAKNKHGISPLMLVTSFNDPAHRKSFHDGVSIPEFISGDEDHIIFDAHLSSRSHHNKQLVRVIYDIREVRKLLTTYKEKNKETSVTSQRVKELDTELKQVKELQQPLIFDRKVQEDRKKIIERYSNIIGLRSFYNAFNKQLNSKITVILEISTNMIDRAHYSKADKVADGVSMLADMPVVGAIVGGAPKVLGAGVQFASDKKEKAKHTKLIKNVPIPALISTFVEDISMGILHAHGVQIAQLNADRSEKLATKAIEIAYETLSAKEIKANTAEIVKHVVEAINCSDKFNKKLQKLLAEQLKDDVKQSAVAPALTQYTAFQQKTIVGKAAHSSAGSAAAGIADLDDEDPRKKCLVM